MSDLIRSDALLAEGTARLRAAPGQARADAAASSGALDAELLLAHVLGGGRASLRATPERLVAPPDAARYRALIARRSRGEPIAYLLGRREFWSLELAVGPDVLVPRPETELLVERALALGDTRALAIGDTRALAPGATHARAGGAPCLRVADLGTGSGAIALALAHERPGWAVVATDRSAAALAVARANARSLGLERIQFLEGSWYEPLAGASFDLIVSNPPYVGAADPALEDPNLRFEPRAALSPGEDALAALELIIAGAPRHLAPDGWLLLEHGSGQADDLRARLCAAGWRSVTCRPDLAGHLRVIEAQRPAIHG